MQKWYVLWLPVCRWNTSTEICLFWAVHRSIQDVPLNSDFCPGLGVGAFYFVDTAPDV
jgi:hypothetical protein